MQLLIGAFINVKEFYKCGCLTDSDHSFPHMGLNAKRGVISGPCLSISVPKWCHLIKVIIFLISELLKREKV